MVHAGAEGTGKALMVSTGQELIPEFYEGDGEFLRLAFLAVASLKA